MKGKCCHDVYAKYVNDLFTLYASSFYTRVCVCMCVCVCGCVCVCVCVGGYSL